MRKKLFALMMVLGIALLLTLPAGYTNIYAKKSKVKLNYSSYELGEGLRFKLKLTGEKAKSFKSSDKYVAKVSKKGYVYGEEIGSATITVTSESGKTYTCKVNVVYNEENHVHTWVSVPGRKATCEKDGLTDGDKCETCGKVFTPQTVIPALGHKYDENGFCTVCGEKDPNYQPPHVHTYVLDTKEPTCTEAGYTGKVYCTGCGDIQSKPKEIKALGHDYFDGYCTRCGMKEVHDYYIIPGKAATCTEPGYTVSSYCKICGEPGEESVMIPPLGHEYNGGKYCIRCGADENGHIHTWVIYKSVKPTCTEPGRTEGKYCSVCGLVVSTQEFILPKGHNFVNGKCTVCGKKENG